MATLSGITVGSYGITIRLTCVDSTGTAQNISAYTGGGTAKTLYAYPPNSSDKVVSATLSFLTDGSDGILTFNFVSGDIDRPGDWKAQVELTTASAVLKSKPFVIAVEQDVS